MAVLYVPYPDVLWSAHPTSVPGNSRASFKMVDWAELMGSEGVTASSQAAAAQNWANVVFGPQTQVYYWQNMTLVEWNGVLLRLPLRMRISPLAPVGVDDASLSAHIQMTGMHNEVLNLGNNPTTVVTDIVLQPFRPRDEWPGIVMRSFSNLIAYGAHRAIAMASIAVRNAERSAFHFRTNGPAPSHSGIARLDELSAVLLSMEKEAADLKQVARANSEALSAIWLSDDPIAAAQAWAQDELQAKALAAGKKLLSRSPSNSSSILAASDDLAIGKTILFYHVYASTQDTLASVRRTSKTNATLDYAKLSVDASSLIWSLRVIAGATAFSPLTFAILQGASTLLSFMAERSDNSKSV